MKKFAVVVLSFLFLSFISSAFGAEGAMKHEGSCSGTLLDGSPVSFNYYSDFDGCTDKSKSAVTFTSGLEGLLTGERSFSKSKDNYKFNGYKISFPDSTGNTSGSFTYTDANGERQTVELACEVRDYTYGDC